MAVSDSFAELMHSGYRYALSLTHDRTQAEDVLQDAWLAVLNANGPHTRVYLFSAVRSRFLNLYRRERLVSVVSLDESSALEAVYEEVDFTSCLDNALLSKALDELRGVEREALFFMAVEGYTANEIAVFTQQPRSTVLSHIHRAKKRIKQFMAQHESEVAS